MSRKSDMPKWLYKNATNRNPLTLNNKTSYEKKIIKYYDENIAFPTVAVIADDRTHRPNLRVIRAAIQTVLVSRPENWSDYKYASFIVDSMPLIIRNYGTAMPDGHPPSDPEKTIMVDSAIKNLTQEELDMLVDRLNFQFYSEEVREALRVKPQIAKCGYATDNSTCGSYLCFAHTANYCEMFDLYLLSDLFSKVLMKSEFVKNDLGNQLVMLSFLSLSRTVEAGEPVRFKFLSTMLEESPRRMTNITLNLLEARQIRVHFVAELLISRMEEDISLARTLLKSEDSKIKAYNISVNKKYLVDDCGWDRDIPEDWFNKALNAENLIKAYRKSVNERKASVGVVL